MMLRSFIAVEIPNELQDQIAHSTALLQKTLPRPLVRWVDVHNVHLTLKFLGDVSHDTLQNISESLQMELVTQKAFTLSARNLGAFPSQRRARVLWIGLDVPAPLIELHKIVEHTCTRFGFDPEMRPFSPHLTIGRVDKNVSDSDLVKISNALSGCSVGNLGTVSVESIQIFKSDLQPNGAVYTSLYHLPFGKE